MSREVFARCSRGVREGVVLCVESALVEIRCVDVHEKDTVARHQFDVTITHHPTKMCSGAVRVGGRGTPGDPALMDSRPVFPVCDSWRAIGRTINGIANNAILRDHDGDLF